MLVWFIKGTAKTNQSRTCESDHKLQRDICVPFWRIYFYRILSKRVHKAKWDIKVPPKQVNLVIYIHTSKWDRTVSLGGVFSSFQISTLYWDTIVPVWSV